MRLALQTFSSLVQNMAASVQASGKHLLDLSAGSALRAILEANASAGLWMQWLIVQVLQTTRAATSTGADLDTWMADFSFARLPAARASGTVTFSRYSALATAFIPAGALVNTSDGTQTLTVVADPTNPAYVASAGGYQVPAGLSSFNAAVQAQVPGAQGNVLAGAVTLLASAIPGIDAVSNASPLAGGRDAETDAAARSRFQSFIDTRSRATARAIGFAVASVQQGLTYTLQENVDTSGASRPGSFVVTVDDGSGAPSASLLGSVYAAVDAVRPVGSLFAVQPPLIVPANVTMMLAAGAGSAAADVTSAVSTSLSNYIEALPIGALLSCSKLASIAYLTSSTISNVTSTTINGAPLDLAVPPSAVVKPGTVVVS